MMDITLEQGIAAAIIIMSFIYFTHQRKALGSPISPHAGIDVCPHFVPVLGHLYFALRNYKSILDVLLSMYDDSHGATGWFLLPFSPPFILTHDPKNIEYVLKTKFESFVKGKYVHDRLEDILGNGIFTVDGHSWKFQRKTAANIFSVKNFRDFVGTVFKEEMDLVIAKVDEALSSPIDVHDLFFRFTLDGFAKIGFGTELDCMKNQSVPFAVAFDRCQATMDFRFFSPLWKLEEMIFFWKKIQLKKDMKTIRQFGLDLIQKRRSEGENPNNSRADLLTLFMQAKDADGKPFSDELLCDFILNFIIAGRDTTAQALSWAIYEICQHPKVQEKLLEEIVNSIGSDSPTYDQVKDMKYANAVFNETLRLHPSVPKNVKEAAVDEVFPDGTVVPKGSVVAWSPYVMGRSTAIWGPSAREFNPERWFDTKIPTAFEYPVFHAGPRQCLGKNLAELEGVFVLVSLLQRYHISSVPNQSVSEISNSPKVLKKLLQEIKETVGNDTPSYEEVKDLKYAKAAFQEALRLHPSVPMNSRQAVEDVTLPDGSYVRKGSRVTWCTYAMGRYESIWGPDAKIFNPERWLDPSRTYSAYEYPVFYCAPRICLGKTLAELEAVFVLASLFQEFKIDSLPNQSISYGDSLTLPMDSPFLCRFTDRK